MYAKGWLETQSADHIIKEVPKKGRVRIWMAKQNRHLGNGYGYHVTIDLFNGSSFVNVDKGRFNNIYEAIEEGNFLASRL